MGAHWGCPQMDVKPVLRVVWMGAVVGAEMMLGMRYLPLPNTFLGISIIGMLIVLGYDTANKTVDGLISRIKV